MACGEGAVRGGRREHGPPSSSEKNRLKYTSRLKSLLSAPLEEREKPTGGCYSTVQNKDKHQGRGVEGRGEVG